MRRIKKISQTTNNRFLNMYTLQMKSDTGKESTYYVASRAKNIDELKITTRQNRADGVIIYSLYQDENDDEENDADPDKYDEDERQGCSCAPVQICD